MKTRQEGKEGTMLAELIPKIAGMEAKEREEEGYRPRPSCSGPEKCLRQLCYGSQGYPGKPFSDRFYLTLDDSSWHEELTADWIRKSAFRLHSTQMGIDITVLDFMPTEPKWYCTLCKKELPGNQFHGHIDGIITDILDQDRLWEHKAINHFAFQRYMDGEYPLDYLTQCATYVRGLANYQIDLRQGNLLIKNKNTSQYLEYLFSYQVETDLLVVEQVISSIGDEAVGHVIPGGGKEFSGLFQAALKRFETIEGHRKAKTLPKRQFPLGSWQCEYCTQGERCWSGYEEEFEAMGEVELDEASIEVVRAYYDIWARCKELEEQKESLNESIKGLLKAKDAKKGRMPGFIAVLDLRSRSYLDGKLIPDEIREKATKESKFEVLNVRRLKDAREAKNKRKEAQPHAN
jgi:hypothetical protein